VRPRLHFAFLLEVAQLDAVATRADGDYDDVLKEVRVTTEAGVRTPGRQEQPTVLIPSQIELPTLEALVQMSAGNMPDMKLTAVWAMKDLERLGLVVPETGELLVRVADRIVSVRENDECKRVIQVVRTPPGLYVTNVQPVFGMAATRDLFLVTLDDREQTTHA
jgi:hypothetical protein